MTALEKAKELTDQAISLLLEEREAIDHQLQILGAAKNPAHKKRGRPSNASKLQPEGPGLDAGRSDNSVNTSG